MRVLDSCELDLVDRCLLVFLERVEVSYHAVMSTLVVKITGAAEVESVFSARKSLMSLSRVVRPPSIVWFFGQDRD